jgi:predicted ATP-dependent protease
MLRADVVAAAQSGQFHVYAVNHVDQAIALLTGVAAGGSDASGQYPLETINHRVAARVLELSTLHKNFARQPEEKRHNRGH